MKKSGKRLSAHGQSVGRRPASPGPDPDEGSSPPLVEDVVFHEAVAGVTPLTPHGRFLHPPAPCLPLPRHGFMDEREALRASMSDPVRWDEDTAFEADTSYLRPGLSRQILRRLRRGEWPPQAELDLHGLTKVEAKTELVDFLLECKRRGARCVRIIHGKGLGSRNREPVLRIHVRHWLTQRDEVLAFVEARPVDGGSGAVIVLLKSPAR